MSSLVAYEDSGSEEDEPLDPREDAASTSVQTGSFKKNQELKLRFNSQVTQGAQPFTPDYHGGIPERSTSPVHVLSRPQGCFDQEINYGGSSGARPKPFEDTAARQSFPATRGKNSPLQKFFHTPQRSGDGMNPAKRQNHLPSVVRPYVPKRQRLSTMVETVDSTCPAERVPGSEAKESHILSDVSERVKPYLGHKPDAAGIPRRLLMQLKGHRGPVNTVQWCPMPHLSHLLLSASMDKTFKVWDGAESGRCLRDYTCHLGAVRDACWTPCGRHLLTGSFDNTTAITDVETGQQITKSDNQFKVMCVALHPSSPDVFLCGGYSAVVKAWDSRSCKMVKTYKTGIQQTLDVLFLRGGVDFITSSDCVSRDSADRTLIAWDFQTTAKVSNQIYHERYTCPSLALHPLEESFVAQTNGNYMAVFSSQQPYRMNKRRRFEGHKVEGYAVQCEFSQDGTILTSGSSTGSAYFYDYHNARTLHTLRAHSQPCLCVSQHPVLPATAATCDWAGEIKIWH